MNPTETAIAVEETIESVAALERKALDEASHHERSIERLTIAVGRPRSLYLLLAFITGWVALNGLAILFGRKPFDTPPFFALDSILQCTSVVLTIMVLVAANRGDALDEQRDRLHLQIAILTERKTAKIIALLEELRRDLPEVIDRPDAEAAEMSAPADPSAVSDELQKRTPSLTDPLR